MKTRLMALLKALEQAIDPGPARHHGIAFCQYGNDDFGFRDQLGLHVQLPDGKYQTLFLSDEDFEKPVEVFVSEALALVNRADAVSEWPAAVMR